MLRKMLLMCGAVLLGVPARASDPVSVYALIDRVEIEPSQGDAQRIRIWGVFSVARDRISDGFAAPARGFLYFALPQEEADLARKEWNDLRKLAGKRTVVGFGSRFQKNVKVRTDADFTKGAVVYPLNVGLQLLSDRNPNVKAVLDFSAKP
jgi:hypothetical protein